MIENTSSNLRDEHSPQGRFYLSIYELLFSVNEWRAGDLGAVLDRQLPRRLIKPTWNSRTDRSFPGDEWPCDYFFGVNFGASLKVE